MPKRRIRVRLTGGLANQLFQWAAGSLLAEEFSAIVELDTRIVERPGQRGEQVTSLLAVPPRLVRPTKPVRTFWRLAHQLLPHKIVAATRRVANIGEKLRRSAQDMDSARRVLRDHPSVFLRGLFQNVSELEAHRDKLAELVVDPPAPTAPYAALHIRRGDYVSNPKYARIFGACSPSYYDGALELIDTSLPVVVCTDDADWARNYIGGRPDSSRFRLSDASDHFEDFAVLRGAEALVLSNSTFSWWAAFLGRSRQIVYPQPWFEDPERDRELPLETWIAIAKHAPVDSQPTSDPAADSDA